MAVKLAHQAAIPHGSESRRLVVVVLGAVRIDGAPRHRQHPHGRRREPALGGLREDPVDPAVEQEKH